MKKILMFGLLILVVFALTSCAVSSTVTQTLVGVPQELQQLIVVLLTAGLTWLLLQLGTLIKLDLTGYIAPLVAVVSPVIITLLERWLGLIPTTFDSLVLAIIHVIVVGLGSLGAFLVFKRKTKATLIG